MYPLTRQWAPAWQRSTTFWVSLFLAVAITLAAAEERSLPNGPSSALEKQADPSKAGHDAAGSGEPVQWMRLREGSKITDQAGEFQKSGDRYSFYPKEGKGSLRVLENLSLERVARTMEDDPAPRLWNVTGVVTEYQGENFLLISRATLKARTFAKPISLDPQFQDDPTAVPLSGAAKVRIVNP